ncbi:hypothetical protein AQ436_01930 [Arthrobacter sp. EpRS66]|nr:hypothetical protein AQ436_01930 [Arthrobacter sp. EpRS66]
MHPVHFFVEVCEDINRSTLPEASEYQLAHAAGRLRLLFLDKQPLVHLINRELRLPLRFRVSSNEAGDLYQDFGTSMDYSAVYAFDGPAQEVSFDGFLKRKAVSVEGLNFTVRNIIKCVAHVYGGIHYLPPEDDNEAKLYAASENLILGNRKLLLHAITDISKVSLEALQPLRQAALASP